MYLTTATGKALVVQVLAHDWALSSPLPHVPPLMLSQCSPKNNHCVGRAASRSLQSQPQAGSSPHPPEHSVSPPF